MSPHLVFCEVFVEKVLTRCRVSKMPFKLRLKKSKQQYNVASKSVYVITVELLDNAQLECTLTSESTGRDCMSNVCQVLNSQLPLKSGGGSQSPSKL